MEICFDKYGHELAEWVFCVVKKKLIKIKVSNQLCHIKRLTLERPSFFFAFFIRHISILYAWIFFFIILNVWCQSVAQKNEKMSPKNVNLNT